MSPARRPCLLVALLTVGPGCLVSPSDSSEVQVLLSGTGSAEYAQSSDLSPWDTLGRFYLSAFPKYVRLAAELSDDKGAYELTSATWPDPDTGVGQGEGPEGEVQITLQVPAGSGRKLRGLAYVAEQGQAVAFAERTPLELDLQAGTAVDQTLELVRLEQGTFDITVRCDQGSVAPWTPDRISLVDIRAQVLLPSVDLLPVEATGALAAEVAAPVGRAFFPRIIVRRFGSLQEKVVELRSRLVSLDQPGERQPLVLQVPCDFDL